MRPAADAAGNCGEATPPAAMGGNFMTVTDAGNEKMVKPAINGLSESEWRERRSTYEKKYREARRREEEELDRLLTSKIARKASAIDTIKAFLTNNPESVALLLYNRNRGMSRARAIEIWGRDFVNAVIPQDAARFVK